jgi:hypothetical protein
MRWSIFILALGFGYTENTYFGWNSLPRSDAELLADGITMILFALSFLKVPA